MLSNNIAFITLFTAISNLTNAAPTNASTHSLAARQQTKETIYLTNCSSKSEYSYDKKGHNSQDHSFPDDTCKFSAGNNLPINWENSFHKCTFGSNVSFETNLGGTQAPNDFIGGGTQRVPDQNPKAFGCFQDNGRVLYRTGSTNCNAIIWCNPRI